MKKGFERGRHENDKQWYESRKRDVKDYKGSFNSNSQIENLFEKAFVKKEKKRERKKKGKKRKNNRRNGRVAP